MELVALARIGGHNGICFGTKQAVRGLFAAKGTNSCHYSSGL